MKIVIAPDSFKESLSAMAVADAIEALGRQAMDQMPDALAHLPRDEVPLRAFDTVGLPALRALLGGGDVPLGAPASTAGVLLQAEPLSSLADALAAKGHGLIMVMGKGGVGKTTIAAALAVGLVQRGHSVHLTTTDPAAQEQSQLRRDKIKELEAQAQKWAGKLDQQDAGQKAKGRKLSDSGAKARLFHAVKEAHLARIIKVDLKGELFSYTVDEAAVAKAQLMDGKLMLVTNVKDLKPKEIVQRYKALADIERGFRVLKSEIEIAPVYHRLPERIRAHAQICFMALIVYRVMRQRLKQAQSELSPERALEQLRRIQRHKVRINEAEPIEGVSAISDAQAQVLGALKVKPPEKKEQMKLL